MTGKRHLVWARVDRSGGDDSCWPWTGRVDRYGYGKLTKKWGFGEGSAHRVVFALANGVTPKTIRGLVRHTCDNPLCCNPRHHVVGSHQDNMADKVARGRQAVGSACWSKSKRFQEYFS